MKDKMIETIDMKDKIIEKADNLIMALFKDLEEANCKIINGGGHSLNLDCVLHDFKHSDKYKAAINVLYTEPVSEDEIDEAMKNVPAPDKWVSLPIYER